MEPNGTQTTLETGRIGEQICARYLLNQGFTIIDLNYRRSWGEIDVIAKKDNKIHFVEVKTVSHETKFDLLRAVTHGTWRPEDNVHAFKHKKLSRVISKWLQDRGWQGEWQIDVMAIRIVSRETYASVNFIENIIIT